MPTELLNLAKLFNNRLFRIPDYQRGYAWGERQLADFWSDLRRVCTDRTYYYGQLTLEKAEVTTWCQWADVSWLVEDEGYEPYIIVDGQQRLTTAVILIQCLLEDMTPDAVLAGQKVSDLRERYLARGNKILKGCLFGYAKDNPSHEFFRTQILGIPSNEYCGTRTLYTNNLAIAKEYLKKQLEALGTSSDRERLFKALTEQFRFNLHELNDEIDVFVAFETMNNRGKPLSRLELLKNRLIYLSTLADRPDAERTTVRANLNAVWRTVYEQLGSNPLEALDDDEFLRAHWIVYFGYDKDDADPLTQFLLNRHFTPERLETNELTLDDIQAYAHSLQVTVRVWQRLHFPENQGALLDKDVTRALVRLKRLGFGVLSPLLLAVLSTEPDLDNLLPVLHEAERFLLLVRSFAGARSNVAEADSYRLANEIHTKSLDISAAASMLRERVRRHFSLEAFQAAINELFGGEEGKGFYGLPGLKFMLFEYEEDLRKKAKVSESKITWDEFSRGTASVEHVYPQAPKAGEWPLFSNFTSEQKSFLRHSLGNLVAVSVGKNASLARRSFGDKKSGTDTRPGFSQGSFSELRIAKYDDWTPSVIVERGLELLRFIEVHWKVDLGSDKARMALLKLCPCGEAAKIDPAADALRSVRRDGVGELGALPECLPNRDGLGVRRLCQGWLAWRGRLEVVSQRL